MILDLFQLLQDFLEFLFALVMSYHDSQFTSYHLREEFSAKLDHLTHLFSLETPVVNEFRHGTQAPLQAKASMRGQDELEDLHLSFFYANLPVRYGTQADTVSHLVTLSRLHVLALLEKDLFSLPLDLHCHRDGQLPHTDLFNSCSELLVQLDYVIMASAHYEKLCHLASLSQRFSNECICLSLALP